MAGIAYFLLFLGIGVFMVRCLLPTMQPVYRVYTGLSLGWLLLLWLPPLWACALRFTLEAHWAALGTEATLGAACFIFRDRRPACKISASQKRILKGLLFTALPLTLLGVYLEYTHTLCLKADGNYYVGQSTYGDLQLHLSIASYAVGAEFPLKNNLLAGEMLVYPHLSDTCASSLMVLGMPLIPAMVVTGSLMLAMVFSGFYLLACRLCRYRGGAALAFFLLFLNGGLGFLYVVDATVQDGSVTGFFENLQTVMTGYYQAPTNQPDPHNLRWVNLICDMFIPQRAILGGWTLLLPALNLLVEQIRAKHASACLPAEAPAKRNLTSWLLTGLFGGALPLVHTHSYLALVLASGGMCIYWVAASERGKKLRSFTPWVVYGAFAAVLSLPQLIGFTFRQTGSSDHFIRLWLNWVNNRNGDGKLVDLYLWFYLKNIGVAFVLIWLSLLERFPRGGKLLPEAAAYIRTKRTLACGAVLIYLAVELVRFQPNVYDNNKLLYVWFLLCLPFGADYAVSAWKKLSSLPGRRVLAAGFLVLCFASSLMTIARECVSSYQAYTPADMECAEYISKNTDKDDLFLTGTQHLNPVSALAGRAVYCGPDLYLYWHGYSTGEQQYAAAAFYEDPESNLDFLKDNDIRYIYVSSYERSSYDVDEDTLNRLYPLVYEGDNGSRIWRVTEK